MPFHVALIRGINVGTAKRVAMSDLRALVEHLGYGDVRTLLNSGNVVFSASASAGRGAAARIEKGLATRVGVPARVTVLNAAELATVVSENPLRQCAENPSRFMVTMYLEQDGRTKLKTMVNENWAPEAFAAGSRAAYFWCPKGIIDSRVAKAIGRALGDAATTRNWATITKLHAMMQAPE
jgi:uncharacterized protein (DUF1697 family)